MLVQTLTDSGQLQYYEDFNPSSRWESLKKIQWNLVYDQFVKCNDVIRRQTARVPRLEELRLRGAMPPLPFPTDNPVMTVINLLVHAGICIDSFHVTWTHIPPNPQTSDKPGGPMLRVALPFPAARFTPKPPQGYMYGFCAHNASIESACNILQEGVVCPSSFNPTDAMQLGYPVHDVDGTIRHAARYGGWRSPRPIYVYTAGYQSADWRSDSTLYKQLDAAKPAALRQHYRLWQWIDG